MLGKHLGKLLLAEESASNQIFGQRCLLLLSLFFSLLELIGSHKLRVSDGLNECFFHGYQHFLLWGYFYIDYKPWYGKSIALEGFFMIPMRTSYLVTIFCLAALPGGLSAFRLFKNESRSEKKELKTKQNALINGRLIKDISNDEIGRAS